MVLGSIAFFFRITCEITRVVKGEMEQKMDRTCTLDGYGRFYIVDGGNLAPPSALTLGCFWLFRGSYRLPGASGGSPAGDFPLLIMRRRQRLSTTKGFFFFSKIRGTFCAFP